jgi:GTP pyrophosphokinase
VAEQYYQPANYEQPAFGHTLADKLCIADTILNELGLGKAAILSIFFQEAVEKKKLSIADIEKKFNTPVASIIQGITRVRELYERNTSLETENFRNYF